jgi:hypothetical protein
MTRGLLSKGRVIASRVGGQAISANPPGQG